MFNLSCHSSSHDLTTTFLWLHTLDGANSSKSRAIHQRRYVICTHWKALIASPQSAGERRPQSKQRRAIQSAAGRRIPLILSLWSGTAYIYSTRVSFQVAMRWPASTNAAALNTWNIKSAPDHPQPPHRCRRRAYICAHREMRERLLAAGRQGQFDYAAVSAPVINCVLSKAAEMRWKRADHYYAPLFKTTRGSGLIFVFYSAPLVCFVLRPVVLWHLENAAGVNVFKRIEHVQMWGLIICLLKIYHDLLIWHF